MPEGWVEGGDGLAAIAIGNTFSGGVVGVRSYISLAYTHGLL